MAQPRISSVHIDRAITNMALRYTNPLFIADQIAPVVPVIKESDKYFIYDKAEWLRDIADDDRRPGSRAPRGGFTLSTGDYALREIAQAMPVPDRVADQSDDPLRPYEDASAWCMQMVLMRRERRAAANWFITGVWGTSATPSNLWSDFINSDPANDIQTGLDTVQQNTGFKPNTLLLGQQVWSKLRLNPDGLDRYKHTRTGVMTLEMAAEWLNVERIIVGGATRNTAAEGATFSGSYVWGKHALLAYVARNPSISEPSAAYIFQKSGTAGLMSKRFREEAEGQDVIENTLLCDMKLVGSDLGYMFISVVA